ncbi:MAG: M23 family metallopeptidase [Bacteroidota bacterium]
MKKAIIYSLVLFIATGVIYDIARPEINGWLGIVAELESETSKDENIVLGEKDEARTTVTEEAIAPMPEATKVEELTSKRVETAQPIIHRLRFPVANKDEASVISFFGDPRAGGKRLHQGIDIEAPRGTPVVAVADGKVSSVGEKGNAGKFVWVTVKSTKTKYFYAHLNEQWVTEGQQVKVGDKLGTVGNTGNARHTLPHLHFEIRKDRVPVNPLPLLKKAVQP